MNTRRVSKTSTDYDVERISSSIVDLRRRKETFRKWYAVRVGVNIVTINSVGWAASYTTITDTGSVRETKYRPRTAVTFGTVNSPSFTFSLIWREMIGTGGYMRNVSMMHRSRYFICSVSWNVTGLSESPNIEYNSSTTFCWNGDENYISATSKTATVTQKSARKIVLPGCLDGRPLGTRRNCCRRLSCRDPGKI